jgi:4-alpha-glucanotransferase
MIQILPVNDTTATGTWTDSYPYAAISAFALHPIYLKLSRVANGPNRQRLAALEEQRQRLNGLEQVDYEAVLNAKLGFLKAIFPSQKRATFRRGDYVQFHAENRHWLEPYAAFCFLRDRFGSADVTAWPHCRAYRPEEIAALAPPGSAAAEELEFHYFVQYHLHAQLSEATAYAHSKGVILKGDIPIGVGRRGADAWQQPELYHLDAQAGAPPDAFAAKGQNWGFPTYNWPRMKQDGFAWWQRRFAQMGRYFDAFRIDHILGFFRIWTIPNHAVEGILGRFVPASPARPEEFASRGIAFDRGRFVEPYLTEEVLRAVFPEDADEVRNRFLQVREDGRCCLKAEFATQRQVERHFAAEPASERNARLKQGLFDLITNVILLETDGPDGPEFHFRFGMETSWSFKLLEARTQAALRELYLDYFFRRQDSLWRREALEKLPALKRGTQMLVCGEDLGLVPACVPEVMAQLGLLGLEVQRMPKRLGHEFSRPQDAPYLSVVTPSTHDMNPLRGWWQEDRAVTQRFFNRELGLAGGAPESCPTWLVKVVILQHLASPAMWAVFQLQDLLGLDAELRHPNPAAERINVPADNRHYWRYRMHLPLERLLAAETFNAELRSCVEENGRAGAYFRS